MSEKYVIVTATSTHRVRYCIPVSSLHMDETVAKEYAKESVTMGDADEFSQLWMGEQIVDTNVVTEEEMLSLFDEDNDYLKNWSKQQKLDYARDWEWKE